MIATNKLTELIKTEFDPFIRQAGFIGSGLSYRKITSEHYIYTLKIQLNKYSGSYCVEMGVYIDFIPNTIKEFVLPSKVTPYDCEFRKRLSPSNNSDYWWNYGNDEKECITNINKMIRVFEKNGLNYFNQFTNFPNPLSTISLNDIEINPIKLQEMGAPLNLRLALLLARVQKYLGNQNEAIGFCDWGLNNIEKATGLIEDFTVIINEIKDN